MARDDQADNDVDFLRALYGPGRIVIGFDAAAAAGSNPGVPKRTLGDRVADDLGQITYDVPFGPAPPELPASRDLSAYDVALDRALRTCPHDTVHQPLYGRAELDCLDCQRHLTVAAYYRERAERSR